MQNIGGGGIAKLFYDNPFIALNYGFATPFLLPSFYWCIITSNQLFPLFSRCCIFMLMYFNSNKLYFDEIVYMQANILFECAM